MTQRRVRVLVVDDSALMREMIGDCLAAAGGIEVVGTAADGRTALARLDELEPDVITLDIQMPNLDGLAALEAILARRPVPVIMVSSLTRLGADITLDALDRGALDYVAKPDGRSEAERALKEDLARKIRAVAGADVRRLLEIRRNRASRAEERAAAVDAMPGLEDRAAAYDDKCLAIGISTGGPPALADLFATLWPPLPPIVVVQHMPAQFTGPFAARLDAVSRLSVKEAESGDTLRPNHVYLAPGGRHLSVRRQGLLVKAQVTEGPPVNGHIPSADVLMKSVAEVYGERCLGIIMTGMGRDGADGCGAIRAAGGYVLGQDEASSDVYGMNKTAFVEGHVDRQFNLDDAAAAIAAQARRMCGARAVAGFGI